MKLPQRGVAACCGVGLLLAFAPAGCGGEAESVQTVLQRRSAALARLPEEDRDWKHHVVPESPTDWAGELAAADELKLDEARQIALRHNPDIHAARARIDQALARIAEARSTYFPTITFGHTANRTFQTPRTGVISNIPVQQPITNLPTNLQDLNITTLVQLLAQPLLGGSFDVGSSGSFSQHTTNLSATWTLFDGLSREATVLATKYTHSAAKMSLADAQRLLIQAIDSAYFQAQLGRERLRIARADVEFSQRQLEATRTRREAGKATQADVLNFEVRLLAAKASEQAGIGLYENARTVLAELMGIQDARLPTTIAVEQLLEETDDDLAHPDPEEWVAQAIAARPDLAQTEFELKSKTEEIKAAKGQYSPSIQMSGTYGYDRLSNLEYSKDDQASAAAIELRWNLYTGGLRTSRVNLTRAQRWEILARLRQRRLQVASEVRQAVTSLVDAQEQVGLQRLNLVAAEENRRIVEAEFGAGKASLVRLNEAQRDLIDTDASLALARIRLRQAWTDLRAAAAVHRTEE